MRAQIELVVRLARRFAENRRGAAAVEFALILPFLLLLFLGSIEASSLLTVDRRVNVISGTVGDLVARWDPTAGPLPGTTLTDYFQASEGILTPYSTTGLEQVVSLVEVAANGTTKVLWSRAPSGGTARVTDSAYTLPPETNQLARDVGCIVVSETRYSYKPVLGLVFTEALSLYNESYYLPRFAECIDPPSAG